MENEKQKAKETVTGALKDFWREFGRVIQIKGKHTAVNIEPKFIIGDKVNPEVAKRLVLIYLMQLTSDKVVNEEVKIDNEGLKIFDKGKLILAISDVKIIDNMKNKVTTRLGRELAKRNGKSGASYLQPNETGIYSFGEIKQGLVDFLYDAEKNDSKNLLKEAVILLFKETN